MLGFLDVRVPSISAEYARYIDPDIRSKILFQNVFCNVLKLSNEDVYVPLGRSRRYDYRGISADAQVRFRGKWLNVECKSSHINIVHPARRKPLHCWSFSRLLATQRRRQKRPYDFAFLAGIHLRGLGDPDFWGHLRPVAKTANLSSGARSLFPHEPGFLRHCGFFLIPFDVIRSNDVSVTISTIEKREYSHFFSPGHDTQRLFDVWKRVSERACQNFDRQSKFSF
jgi:hypothetical protein